MANATHGEPVAWKLARPVRREGRRNHLPKGRQALCSYSTFRCLGPLHCGLDGSRKGRGRSDRTHRAGTAWRAARGDFLVARGMAAQPAGDESFGAPLREHERGEAVLRPDMPHRAREWSPVVKGRNMQWRSTSLGLELLFTGPIGSWRLKAFLLSQWQSSAHARLYRKTWPIELQRGSAPGGFMAKQTKPFVVEFKQSRNLKTVSQSPRSGAR
ncbi:hypothetical protein JOH51_007364 [Rhizobium leguminosarum]|nr:hypothetical protein [Rhizobium leguminosarum]